VLGCLDAERAPFAKGTLVGFRARLIAHNLDRRLVERTVQLARQRGGFGDRALRAALDASPLWGAGRVEDTINLLGHALRKALGVIARQQGRGLSWNQGITAVADQAGVAALGGLGFPNRLGRDWACRVHAIQRDAPARSYAQASCSQPTSTSRIGDPG
jgi:hypothetical protein